MAENTAQQSTFTTHPWPPVAGTKPLFYRSVRWYSVITSLCCECSHLSRSKMDARQSGRAHRVRATSCKSSQGVRARQCAGKSSLQRYRHSAWRATCSSMFTPCRKMVARSTARSKTPTRLSTEPKRCASSSRTTSKTLAPVVSGCTAVVLLRRRSWTEEMMWRVVDRLSASMRSSLDCCTARTGWNNTAARHLGKLQERWAMANGTRERAYGRINCSTRGRAGCSAREIRVSASKTSSLLGSCTNAIASGGKDCLHRAMDAFGTLGSPRTTISVWAGACGQSGP